MHLDRQIQPWGQKRNPNFKVLLSLYKPNRNFLKIQLDSISNQIEVDVELIVRIDGLDRELHEWVEGYLQELGIKFTVMTGDRIGAGASFLELLRCVQNYEYVSFSDQDDYWANSKLKSTVLLNGNNYPTLSVAGMKDFKHDDQISSILGSKEKLASNPEVFSFNNAIIENVFQGARMTLNKSATDLIKSNLPNVDNIVMHDAWIYLVLSAFGCVREASEITFLYRQHQNNLIGLKSGRFLNRLKRILSKNVDMRMLMAREFAVRYPNSRYAKIAGIYSEVLLESRFERLRVLSNLKLKRSKKSDLFLFYFLIFLRKKQ